ncbi:12081_t:CDS:2 [Ambispora gerdemannii]|uniref:Ammonium transporter n=1 Tax=Ambispora gerdemannii TaxID=144530 RepID=A0A9N8VQH3_9GLOM|nr:12081_t:CDS:2 [Ambispora gerdemannii]
MASNPSNETSITSPIKYETGDIGFVLVATAQVFLMAPGIGYFYSGMARSKNALSMILLCLASTAVVTFQWWLWGYSLTYSTTGGDFIGNLDHMFYRNVFDGQSDMAKTIPDLVFANYQCMFAALTPALVVGAAAERNRMLPTIVFIFIWTTLVYDVIAHWTWSKRGWAHKIGSIDFAGGTPVHITSGAAALAYAMTLGKRNGHGMEEFRPHNISSIALGTVLLWFGWFGFNGGSAFSANLQAANAIVATNLAGVVGGLSWMLLDYRLERKLSILSFCSGVISGFVTITPGAGYVSPASAVLFGLLAGSICNMSVKLKHFLAIDDALDVFAVHGIGGLLGNVLTGIFAQKSIAQYAGRMETEFAGGWLDGNWVQVGYQLAGSVAGLVYSFSVTYFILFILNKIPGLALRVDPESEKRGLDETEMGEIALFHATKLVATNPRTGELRVIRETSLFQSNENDIPMERIERRPFVN